MAEPITVKINGLNSPIATVKIQNKVAESAVTSVAGKVGDVLLTNADIAGVENVNNTSDLNKPISIATQAAIDAIDVSSYSQIGHKHFLADISGAGTAAAADVGDFATSSHTHPIGDIIGLGTAATSDSSDFATSTQGAKADSALQSVVAGANISIDNTDPQNPIISGAVGGGNVDSVNTQTGVVVLDADDISDASTTNKFTTQSDIDKLSGISAGAEANVNADWNSVGGDSEILNKPSFGDITGSSTGDFAQASHSHVVSDITDLNTGIFAVTGHVHTVSDITNAGTMISANTGDYQLVSQKGVAGGYASLDGGGRVPSAQLPSYVDDVLEYPSSANFPNPGEFGKIYVALDTNYIYRWGGSSYVQVGGGEGASPPVLSVNTLTGAVVLETDDISDLLNANKFITQEELDKLSGIASGAEVNVNADWNATNGDAEILNKPSFGTMTGANTGDYTLTGHTHVVNDITNLGTIATFDSGDYSLSGHTHQTGDIIGLGSAAGEDISYFALSAHTHSTNDIIGLGTSATRDVASVGDAADSEVVLGSDTRLDLADSLGSAAYRDVPSVGDAGLTEAVLGSDTRLTDSRDPNNHALNHTDGTDDIQDATTGQKGLATSGQIQQLEDLAANTGSYSITGHTHVVADITDLDTGAFALTGHTHPLSDLEQGGATDGQAIVWDTGSNSWVADTIAGGGGTSTLSETSSASNDTAKSLYSMTAGIPVEFEAANSNTILYLDETGERVGVGGTPSGQLHIKGSAEPEFIIDALAGGPDLNFAVVGDIKTKIVYDTIENGLSFNVEASNVGTSFPFANNDLFIKDGGRIGIGTNTPEAHLHIDRSGVGPQEFLKINSIDGNGRLISFYDTGNFVGGIDYNFSANYFSFDVTNASDVRVNDAFVIKSESNDNFIGIGTNAPDAKLHISGGSIKIVDGTEGLDKVLTSDADGLATWGTLDSFALTGHTHVVADITDLDTGAFATSGQGALADSAIQPLDNISELTNDAGYITSADTSSFQYRAETGNYTVAATDYTVNCISGNQTITMLDATTVSGQIFVVKNSSTGVITITGTSSQTFDGYDSLQTDFPQSLTLQSTNTNWIII